MVWSIDTDDFHGDCERARQSSESEDAKGYAFPLLRAIHRAIEDYSFDDSENDIDSNEISTHDTSKKSSAVRSIAPLLLMLFPSLTFLAL